MKITRRRFIAMGSIASLSTPLLLQNCSNAGETAREVLMSPEDLYLSFTDPPNNARPFVRWWWNGNRLDEKEILRELDLLKEAGIGGVEINPIRFPDGCDPGKYKSLEWLSDEWIRLLQITLQAAKSRGIICDIIVGSGWPFGGEFLNENERTQLVTIETINLEGPASFVLSSQELLDRIDPPIHSKYEGLTKEIIDLRLAPAKMEAFDPGIDLKDKIAETISIQVPEGSCVLYCVAKLTGFQAVINGSPGAAGPVLNHYSKPAVEKYLSTMSEGLKDTIGKLGDSFRAMFCDSLEMEGANWNDDLPAEFEKRRGYALGPYLPFILQKIGHMGNPLEEKYGSQMSDELLLDMQRVRYDFYITRMELFKERFIDTFNSWCAQNGVKSRVQAYGRGYHPIEASMSIDIPESETWFRETIGTKFSNVGWEGRGYTPINKFVASGAHLAGKKLVSCEEITNTEKVFNASLEDIKITGDQSNLSGVTHSVLHGFNYSPADVPFPGWIQYGTFFNERNPWWPFVRLWTNYKSRVSFMLQQIEPVADIAIMHPLADMWLKYGPQRDPFPVIKHPEYQHNVWEAIHQNGHGCDYISEKILQGSTFKDGTLRYGTRTYSTLLLLEVESMLPATARALNDFADAGGKIIFIEKVPHRSPGLLDKEKNDEFVLNTVKDLLKVDGRRIGIYPRPADGLINWFRALGDKYNITPYMKIDHPAPFVNQIFGRVGEMDVFFFSNYSLDESYDLNVKFEVQRKVPYVWDCETGEKHLLPTNVALNELQLRFGPAESKLIVFEPKDPGLRVMPHIDQSENTLLIEGPWNLRLFHVNGGEEELSIDVLMDFKDHPVLGTFGGKVVFAKDIQVDAPDSFRTIDLGKVLGVSNVMVNGKPLGTKWYGNRQYSLDGALVKGANHIEVTLYTTMGNYMKSLKDNATAQRWTSRQEYRSNGWIGPLRLL